MRYFIVLLVIILFLIIALFDPNNANQSIGDSIDEARGTTDPGKVLLVPTPTPAFPRPPWYE